MRSLICLAYDTLHEAVNSSQDSAVHLCHSVHNMFELYCDVVPSYHRERLKNMPLLAGKDLFILSGLLVIGPSLSVCN